jgi:branched-chain amino acid transport system substrate-binding protein
MKKVGMCLLIGGLFIFAAQMTFAGSVKLGVVGPLTGPVAVGGIQTKYGLELAKDEINSRGGIPGVGEIEFIYEDDKCVPPESGNAVNKLVYRNKVLAVIGSVCSSSTMAGMIVSQKAKTPQITAVSTSPAITQKGNKWIFRSSIADVTRAGALAEFAVKKLKKTKVGIIHDADDYGRDGAYAFADKLKEFNIEPKVIESFNRKDKDFSGQLSKMAKQGVEVLVIWGLPEESALIAKQVKAMNLNVQIMGGDPVANSRFIELAGPAAEGAMTGIGFVPTNPDPKVQAFISEIQKRYKTSVTNVVANAYDCLYILAKAIEKSGADKAKLRDALAGIRYEGITGVTTFDENGGSLRKPIIVVVKNGKVYKYE